MEKLRIDKWLWAARFYKTRALAQDEIERGRVRINDAEVKASREVGAGDMVALRREAAVIRTFVVRGVSRQRGPAPVAQRLYEETAESVAVNARAAEQRRLAPEPAHSIEHGRPTKRERRDIDAAGKPSSGWGDRWRAEWDGADR